MTSRRSAPQGSVKIGYVRRAHGIKGAVIIRVLGDEDAQYAPSRVLVTDNAQLAVLTVVSAHPHKEGLLVRFSEVDDRNAAEDLRGTSLFVDETQRRELDVDEYWPEQLLGLDVVSSDGAALGTVAEVVAGAAQDRLRVANNSGLHDVPFVAAIVTSVDLESGRVVLDPPEGLL